MGAAADSGDRSRGSRPLSDLAVLGAGERSVGSAAYGQGPHHRARSRPDGPAAHRLARPQCHPLCPGNRPDAAATGVNWCPHALNISTEWACSSIVAGTAVDAHPRLAAPRGRARRSRPTRHDAPRRRLVAGDLAGLCRRPYRSWRRGGLPPIISTPIRRDDRRPAVRLGCRAPPRLLPHAIPPTTHSFARPLKKQRILTKR